MSDKPETIDYAEAVTRLPEGNTIHTFRQNRVALLGAGWPRKKLLAALKAAKEIHVTGEGAQAMHHGIAIQDKRGTLFIETVDC